MAFNSNTNQHITGPRQKWDQRYAALAAGELNEPTFFVTSCLPYLPQVGRALDIAAGTGRNSLALARWGLQVDAVDISWQGLRLGRRRALEAGVAGKQIQQGLSPIQFIVADVERPWLPHRSYQVILVSRFLYRPLLPLIKERLGPGGWLIYETFLAEPPARPGRSLPMSDHFLLQPGELKEAFSELEIIFYHEPDPGNRSDEQRPLAQLLARKPAL